MAGRFAPSPTADLHLGNLRTALVAWLLARSSGRRFRLRVEDLDAQRVTAAGSVAERQLADLAAIGVDVDGKVWWQSRRLDAYVEAVGALETYPCYCTRREIAEAASAPHGTHRPYPGTCLRLPARRRAELAMTRPPALRVRANAAFSRVQDLWAGEVGEVVDDFVVVRNDGVPAYNLAVVVDDLAMSVDQVCRGDDLLSSSPRQAWLARQLGGDPPAYAHVPLAVNRQGRRLAKRDGAVTLADQLRLGRTPEAVLSRLANSLDLAEPGEAVNTAGLLARFDPVRVPRKPWVVT